MAASNYQIAGGLNFNPQMGNLSNYGSAYQAALQLNQQNYQNILQGYQQTVANQLAAQQNVQAGYGQLSTNVLSTIQGIDASQRQAIADSYAAQAGQANQGLINRGLGNTTVRDSVQRGLSLDNAKANIALTNQTQQLTAGYQSQLGLAGLSYGGQAVRENTALANQQLQWQNSVNAPYPNAQLYSQLAMQRGAVRQGSSGAMPMGGSTAGGSSGANGYFRPGAVSGGGGYFGTNLQGYGQNTANRSGSSRSDTGSSLTDIYPASASNYGQTEEPPLYDSEQQGTGENYPMSKPDGELGDFAYEPEASGYSGFDYGGGE